MQDNTAPVPTASDLLDVIDEAESLWPHNSHAVEDSGIEMAVLAALDKPHDAPNGVALYRRAGSHSNPVRRLFSVVFGRSGGWSDADFFVAPCDRCSADVQPRHTLDVNVGSTVVSVHCCDRCRTQLDSRLSGLVWS